MISLREYQVAAVDELRLKMRRGIRKLLLSAPTGSGKTVVAVYIIASALAKGKRILFIAHRRELINQTVAKLIEMGIDEKLIGVIMAKDRRTDASAPVQVASIQTLSRRKNLPDADLVIVDEAHHSMADTYIRQINHYASIGSVVLGMTATPYRADNRGLDVAYDDLSLVATPWQLIDNGFLVEPQIWTAPPESMHWLDSVKITAGEYNMAQLDIGMNNNRLVGNIVEQWKLHAPGVRTIAFACSVEHSTHIVDQFVNAGVTAEHIDAKTPAMDRDAVLHRLETGETTVVSNVGICTEGWDQPSVKCCILARPTRSLGLYIQMAGRILRPYDSQVAIILDHAACHERHGRPHDDRNITLHGVSSEKASKTCPKCHVVIVLDVNKCPECGHVFDPVPVKESLGGGGGGTVQARKVDGNLIEVPMGKPEPPSREEMEEFWVRTVETWMYRNKHRESMAQKKIPFSMCSVRFKEKFGIYPPKDFPSLFKDASVEEKRKRYDEFVEQALHKNYGQWYVDKQFQSMFGHWPDRGWTMVKAKEAQ